MGPIIPVLEFAVVEFAVVEQSPTDPVATAVWCALAAEGTPGGLAIIDQRRAVDHQELHSASGALAAQLLMRSSEHGSLTWLPILVDRSIESCIAVLAALRAGIPFAPIDAATPPRRVTELFSRLGGPPVAVVASMVTGTLVPDGVEALSPLGHRDAQPPLMAVDPGAPAVVVFTSGSTGAPKAVVRPWRMFSPEPDGFADKGPIEAGSILRHGLLLPLSFSAGLNVLAPLRGRSLHIADPSAMSGDHLLRWLAEQQVESLEVPPSLAATLARLGAGRRLLPDLKIIRLFGEPFDWMLVAALRSLGGPELDILTSYSATESGTGTKKVIGPETPLGSGQVGMGFPVAAGRVRLTASGSLLAASTSAGAGAPTTGQILVREPAALGYLEDLGGDSRTLTRTTRGLAMDPSDPALASGDHASQRFVIAPDGTHWWFSGDLGEFDAAGELHHRGRVDDLVKINGVLVEPASAERVLRRVPGVVNAAVVAHELVPNRAVLVGHLELAHDIDIVDIRAAMVEQLPPAAIARVLMRHENLPVTARGKIDRAALRDTTVTPWVADHRGPADDRQGFLAAHMAEILGLPAVGVDDDLFALGLDSLAAVEFLQVVTDLGLGRLDPSRLAALRTISAIALELDGASVERRSDVVTLNAAGTAPLILCVPGAGDMAARFWARAAALGADQPIAVVEAHGMHTRAAVDRTIEAAAGRVAAEATDRCPQGPIRLMGHSVGALVALEAAHRLAAAGREVSVALLDPAAGRNVARSPSPSGTKSEPADVDGSLRTHASKSRRLLHIIKSLPLMNRDEIRFRLYARFPGPPRSDPRRYRAFHLIGVHAALNHQPTQANFPVLALRARDTHVDPWVLERLDPTTSFTVAAVDGDHLSFLQPPHVHEVAARLRGFYDAGSATDELGSSLTRR